MKRLFTIAIMLIVLSAGAQAQHGHKKRSARSYSERGQNSTYIPDHVKKRTWTIHRKNQMDWVSTRKVSRRHRTVFIVTMKRGPWVIEYTMNKNGAVIARSKQKKYRHDYANRYAYGNKTVTYEYWSSSPTFSRSYRRY